MTRLHKATARQARIDANERDKKIVKPDFA